MAIEITAKEVDRFLRTGRLESALSSEMAAACDRRVREATLRSNKEALSLGRRFLRRARPPGGVLLTTALRACGWATLVAGEYRNSEKHYLEARELAKRDAAARGRIDRILIDVYMYLDNIGEANRRARMSLATFRRLKLPADLAKTKANFANLLHRQDRHGEAGKLYRQAAEFFDEEGIEIGAALCYYNLANTCVQQFDFDEAEQLYAKARHVFEAQRDQLHSTACLYGLAWLHMLKGEYHVALRELTECETAYRQGGRTRELLLCLLDRAETYLALNLFVDARGAASQALRFADRLKLSYESAKASLFAGRALLGMGRRREARDALGRAAAGFGKSRNKSFKAVTRFSQSQAASKSADRKRLLERASHQFNMAQLPLWQALCDLQQLKDQPENQTVEARLEKNPAVKSVPHLYVGWHTWRGDRAALRNDPKQARQHWARAADTLDAVRSQLPPVELRTAYMRNEPRPFDRLIDAEALHNASSASAWAERRRAGGVWAAPALLKAESPERRKLETSLAALASQVAAYSGMVGPAGGSRGFGMAPASREQRKLQSQIRNHLIEMEVPAAAQHTTHAVEELFRETSMHQPIVQFYLGQRDLLAFVHHRGLCHSHRYVEGRVYLDELVARWRFLIECSAYTPSGYSSTTGADERDILERISRWLLPPLQIPEGAKKLLIIPEGHLVALPWLALRTNRGILADHTDLCLAPSLRHHVHARGIRSRGSDIRIYVGSRRGLKHVDAELEALRGRFDRKQTELFDPSTRADWTTGGASRIWHYSGHATLRADNPFYSALELSDGPLYAADLRLRHHRVGLVTLAACRTGPHTQLPGDESTGLVRSLLEMGARNVVASHWAVGDRSTARWMDIFYRHYLAGQTVSRAVRWTAMEMRETFPRVFHWGAFSAFGSG